MVRFVRESAGGEVSDPLLRPLFDDMVACEGLLDNAVSETLQFARRTYFRAFFAYLEGHLHWLKGNVEKWLLASGWQAQQLDITKLILLEDNTHKPDKTGKLVSEPNRLPFLNWCAFILRTAAECWDVDPATMFGDNGWQSLQTSLRVRHRLTHPKHPADLDISQYEIDTLRIAHTWFLNCIVYVVNAAGAAIGRRHKGTA